MAAPVWQLSVNLETKTATFTTGLADAAKQARGSFNDIKAGAGDMGGRVSYSMMEARHSVMMLGEEFGVRLPRSLTTFIAGLGPIGPALEAAFPFLALAGLATILIEHLNKLHEAGEKLTSDQIGFETAANNAFNSLGDKLLTAQIKVDELHKNHLVALKHRLELINNQSLGELQHSFLELAKSIEPVMKDLEGHWYTFGEGADGAKHALDDFRTHYEFLLSEKKEDDANGLLTGTLAQARKTLSMMDQLKASRAGDGQKGDYAQYEKAAGYLEQMGVFSKTTGDYTKTTYEAQLNLVSALQDQVNARERILAIQKLEGQAATITTHNEMNKDNDSLAKHRAEEDAKAERGFNENFKRFEDERVQVTEQGSSERLDALRAALADAGAIYGEESAQYQHYADEYAKAYRDLSTRTLEIVDEELQREDKLKGEAAREAADNSEKMGMLSLARMKQQLALAESTKRQTTDRAASDAAREADIEYNIKMAALQKEIKGLDKFSNDYLNKLKALQDKEKQLTQQHEDQITGIMENAEESRNKRIMAAESQLFQSIAQNVTQSIMGHQTWAKSLLSLGDEVVSSIVKNTLLVLMQQDKERLGDAKTAASNTYKTVSGIPVVGPYLAPEAAAGAFAAVMAFNKGTDNVPGVGHGDVVPTMLTPGEGVVPGGVMDGLRQVAKNGGFERGPRVHATAYFAPKIQAFDADGVDKVLDKHQDKFQHQFELTLRRMNV